MRLIDADAILAKMIRTNRYWDIKFDIDEAPTIESEPVKHGRWEEHICFDDGFWICSNCKFVSQATAAPKLYRYCPNCGAKMDEEDET